jgi:chorismate--pyruvate lyase
VSGDIPIWRDAATIPAGTLPEGLREWLLEPGSLTRRMRLYCDGLKLSLLARAHARPFHDEASILHTHYQEYAFVRQVRLGCADQPWMYARTIMPLKTLTGAERRFQRLGGKPLGDVLFSGKPKARGPLEIARILPRHRLFQLATADLDLEASELWGRRSVFFLHAKPMLVTEVFLPGIYSAKKLVS